MLYPYIYTGTRYHDFRVVTSQMLHNLPNSLAQYFEDVAHAMIMAENNQLMFPSWILVKKEGYILWGMASLNNVLGDKSDDDDKRPVRGFFGFITDGTISKLPFSISFFKELYAKYVLPIWDSYEQTEQVTESMPAISGFDFIEKSSCLSSEINVNDSICRIFPNSFESKSLIEAVFASSGDCSIATNIHTKKQCVEFGKDKLSFTNTIAATDLKISEIEDVRVYVPKGTPITIHEKPIEDDKSDNKESFSSICGHPVNENEDVYIDCEKGQRNKKYVKYGLYGFMALICLLLMFNGSSIWEIILPPKHTQENIQIEEDKDDGRSGRYMSLSPFLSTSKQEVNVIDANSVDVFKFAYESSSLITQVKSADNWIRIITPQQQFSKKGIIEFMCDPLTRSRREGSICLTNDEGIEIILPIYQTVSTEERNVEDTPLEVCTSGNKPAAVHNEIVRKSDVTSSANVQNAETASIVEPTNH